GETKPCPTCLFPENSQVARKWGGQKKIVSPCHSPSPGQYVGLKNRLKRETFVGGSFITISREDSYDVELSASLGRSERQKAREIFTVAARLPDLGAPRGADPIDRGEFDIFLHRPHPSGRWRLRLVGGGRQ